MKKTSLPQLKDIASAAGVSMATASIILRNGNGRFAEETRQRVLEVAKKLGWRQNLLVQSIQTGKTRTIGVLIPPFDSYWTNVLTGIHQALTEADYMPITLWVGDGEHFADNGQGLEQIHKLVDRRVEGILVWPDFASAYKDYFRELIERGIPLVVVDHALEDCRLADSVQTDEELGGRLVAEHLLKLGHRNIGCVTEFEKDARSWQLRRQRYFEFALHTMAPDVQYRVWHRSEERADVIELAKEILRMKDRPTALFAETDHLAYDLYFAAADLGVRIPEELSIVGFSDLDFSRQMRPPLTTVRQNGIEVGKCAGQAIVRRIKKEVTSPASTIIRVSCDLIVRSSTAAPPAKTTK
ncbi:MAG TPA: LacI family DNA-binding transcriptional regulator [Anaerohalosphaeraceae bacterium]|nr:LacI family DNA-binding transcriptional regulator [Anaerohalosphaeraceae bacterium]